MKKRPLLYALLLALMALITTCTDKTSDIVRVAHNSWPGYEPLILAEHEELYKNVNVINFRVDSATDAVRAFEHHIVDVVALTLDEALLLHSKHPEPLVIITVLDISNGGDAIVAQGDIHSIQELKGKRVGVESTALGAFFLTRAVDVTPGINIKQLQIVPLRYNNHHDAFIAKQVDAVVTFEPVTSMLIEKGGNSIFDSSEIPNEIIDALITRESFFEKNKHALRGLVRGYFKALDKINSNPEKHHPIMADFEGVSAEAFTQSLSGLRIPDRKTNRRLLGSDKPGLIDTIEKVQGFMLEKGIIRHPPHTNIRLSDNFIPANSNDY